MFPCFSTLFRTSIPTSFKIYVKNVFTLVHVLLPIDLHPDVNLKRTIDDNYSSQCRVQFNVSVSDSIHMYIDTCIYQCV